MNESRNSYIRGRQAAKLSPAFSRKRLASLVIFSICVTLFATGCSASGRSPSGKVEQHRRLGPYTYIEEGDLVTLAVGVEAARHRADEEFIPLAIGISNNGLRSLSLTRESLTLIDDQDRRLALATVKEVKSLGSRTLMDLRLSNPFAQVFGSHHGAWPRVNVVFFPIGISTPEFRSRGLVADEIGLDKHAWMIDVIYFPRPEGDLLGRRYELWLDTEELEEPVFVKFGIE